MYDTPYIITSIHLPLHTTTIWPIINGPFSWSWRRANHTHSVHQAGEAKASRHGPMQDFTAFSIFSWGSPSGLRIMLLPEFPTGTGASTYHGTEIRKSGEAHNNFSFQGRVVAGQAPGPETEGAWDPPGGLILAGMRGPRLRCRRAVGMKIGKRAAAQDETRQGNGLGRNGTSVSGCGGGCGGLEGGKSHC